MLFSEGWRRPFGAGEDRNRHSGGRHRLSLSGGWRRPFGAGEDRNLGGRAGHLGERRVAPALRGWRGSQHRRAAVRGPSRDRWRRPFGAGEDRNHLDDTTDVTPAIGGAGPSGLARIATPPAGWARPPPTGGAGPSGLARIATIPDLAGLSPSLLWRRPFGAGEDRNRLGGVTARLGQRQWGRPFGAGEDRNSMRHHGGHRLCDLVRWSPGVGGDCNGW